MCPKQIASKGNAAKVAPNGEASDNESRGKHESLSTNLKIRVTRSVLIRCFLFALSV
jgi:hypothetical protein